MEKAAVDVRRQCSGARGPRDTALSLLPPPDADVHPPPFVTPHAVRIRCLSPWPPSPCLRAAGIEDLREKREELNRSILRDEEDKAKIQKELTILTERLSRINEDLARKMQARNEFDQTIQETEAAYMKVRAWAGPGRPRSAAVRWPRGLSLPRFVG
jgi:hypothetical protein